MNVAPIMRPLIKLPKKKEKSMDNRVILLEVILGAFILYSIFPVRANQGFKHTCHMCGSLDIEEASPDNKVKNHMLLGIFSAGRGPKTFRCKKCKYRW